MKNIFYHPISKKLDHPGDRRRFYGFAKKKKLKLNFERNESYSNSLLVLSQNADLSIIANKKYKNSKIIFDFCDGYLNEKLSTKKLLRGVYKYISGKNKYLYFSYTNLLKKICKMADAVVCASNAQKKAIEKYNKNVFVIYDFIDDEIDFQKKDFTYSGKFKIVWEGLSSNLVHLENFIEIFREIKKNIPIELHVVTDEYNTYPLINYKINNKSRLEKIFGVTNLIFHKWEIGTFSRIIKSCDLAIIPGNVDYHDYFNFKSANKLRILWKIGIPVLCSPSVEHHIVKKHTNLDFICEDKNSWVKNILKLSKSIDERKKNVASGNKYFSDKFSESNINAAWTKVFYSIGENI